MEGLCQKFYVHALLRDKGACAPRINLTFRKIVQHKQYCSLANEWQTGNIGLSTVKAPIISLESNIASINNNVTQKPGATLTCFIKHNNVPIFPVNSKNKNIYNTQTQNQQLAKSVKLPILPLDSVDNHSCNTSHNHKPNIQTTISQPCTDDISLQNLSGEKTSPPSAIHKYDDNKITFYLCNINSASHAAKNYLFSKCGKHHVWSILETRCATNKNYKPLNKSYLPTNVHAAAI